MRPVAPDLAACLVAAAHDRLASGPVL